MNFYFSVDRIDITLGTLLDRAGITVDKHDPQEILDPVERAFMKLAEIQIIADSLYPSLVEGSKMRYPFRWLGNDTATVRQQQAIIEGRLHLWRKEYLKRRIHIAPGRRVSADTRVASRAKS